MDAINRARRHAPGRRRATDRASGGRLVSLVDGKEYSVPSGGVVIGRDAGCDVVVGKNEVSRRHAEIAPTDQGYFVRDMSSNGVFVNGERVRGSQRLARADVIRVGGEEFRFYADMLATSASASAATRRKGSRPSRVIRCRVASSLGAAVHPRGCGSLGGSCRTAPLEEARPALVTLEVLNEGLSKGNRYTIRTPLAHVGRGAHNDVRLTDESVSETHAKLQRRDDGWYAVDMNSTNGTYVGGSRVAGERRIDGAPDVRFGGVKLRFLPTDMKSPALDGGHSSRQRRRTDTRSCQSRHPAPTPSRRGTEGGHGVRWAPARARHRRRGLLRARGRA